jgi:hypothetical protein
MILVASRLTKEKAALRADYLCGAPETLTLALVSERETRSIPHRFNGFNRFPQWVKSFTLACVDR